MAIKFFGQFLIDKKVITKLELLRAIELQENTNLRFGDLVTEMGLMSREQIDITHRAQRNKDLQFGDMAVKLGFLSPDQIELVLDRQRREHLYIGEALVKLKVITEKNLDLYLNDFKQTQKDHVPEKIVIPAAVPHQPIWEIAADMTYKMLTRVAGVTFRTGPCTITETLPAQSTVFEIDFSGAVDARYLLTASENCRKLLANAILREGKVETGTAKEIDDSVKEFVNIVCGNVVSKAAQLGYSIDITTAQMYQQNDTNLKIPVDQIGLMFPIYFSDGELLELTILVQKER